MDTLVLAIRFGILLGVFGALASGVVALLGGRRGHRLAQGMLVVSSCASAVATAVFLAHQFPRIEILRLPIFFASWELHWLSAVFLLIASTVSGMAAIYAVGYLEHHGGSSIHIPSTDALTAVFIAGMYAVLLATNIAGFMVAWETMSIASYLLVMADHDDRSIRAALLYLVMTHLGAAALLTGFLLVSGGNPTTSFSELMRLAPSLTPGRVTCAWILFFIGFGSKAGLVPLHIWLPEAHPQAPSHVSALMSGVMLKVAVYGFIITTMVMLPLRSPVYGVVVMVVGTLSGIIGALHAIVNTDVKQTLAWSSIENLGLMFVMLGTSMYASAVGLPGLAAIAVVAALFHAVNHAWYKSGLFFVAGALVQAMHTRDLEAMGGLARRIPIMSGAFLILALAASALPPFGTFFGEWVFLQALLDAFPHSGHGVAVLVAVFSGVVLISGLAIIAMVKLFAIATLGQPRSDAAAHAREPAAALWVPIAGCAVLVLMMGVAARGLFGVLGVPTPLVEHALGIRTGGSSLALGTPVLLPITLLAAIAAVLLVRFLLGGRLRSRVYHTWDCGQPITAHMEYTATAFSAPIRFFFRSLLHMQKEIRVTPIVPTNPFLVARSMTMHVRSIWWEYFHLPIARLFLWKSRQVKRLQSGVIQFYLILIFVALVVTLAVAV